ncbi:hypothetical protein Mapa_010523 [Marchantia paleacea]|nr:hypothetical protein Mapa_010523 [Marchantia paleacea]
MMLMSIVANIVSIRSLETPSRLHGECGCQDLHAFCCLTISSKVHAGCGWRWMHALQSITRPL